MTVVLDAWAVVELVKGTHQSAPHIQAMLDRERPLMSWLNLGEVFYGFRRGHGDDEAIALVRDLRAAVDAVLPDEDAVLAAARIKSEYPMSYADSFAAALAMRADAELWTGDPELLVDGSPWRWRDLRKV